MKRAPYLLAIAVLCGVLAGCSNTVPVQQVHSSIFGKHSQDQVRTAILLAGKNREWIMTEETPGVITARQTARQHGVVVNIHYTSTTYSIDYVSSSNMDAAKGKIHKKYNTWVRNLDKDIQLNLSLSTN